MKKTYVKAMTAAAIITLSASLPFPAMAAKKFYIPNNGFVFIMGGNKNFCWDNQDSIIGTPDINIPGFGNSENNESDSSDDSVSQSEYVNQVLSLVNEERAKSGLSPLTLDTAACSAAQTRAREIVSNFSHTRPGGKSFSTALTESGVTFRSAGENIASGQTTPAQVMNGWMNSSGHRANIMNKNYTKIGIGHYEDAAGTDYWVQIFFH